MRERRAFEAVHPDDGAGASHVQQLPSHLLGVVRERFNLLTRQHGTEGGPAPVGRRGRAILAHGDSVLDLGQSKDDGLAVVARAHAHIAHGRGFEPVELGAYEVASRRQRL